MIDLFLVTNHRSVCNVKSIHTVSLDSDNGDIFQEIERKRHQELQTNLLAIKYVQTVKK